MTATQLPLVAVPECQNKRCTKAAQQDRWGDYTTYCDWHLTHTDPLCSCDCRDCMAILDRIRTEHSTEECGHTDKKHGRVWV